MLSVKILSLFPGYFKGPFDESILARAIEKGLLSIDLIDIRSFAEGKHRRVDERPYGGGPGMVLQPEPVAKAIRSVKTEDSWVVFLTPQGTPFTSHKAKELAVKKDLIFLCGHYEGVDERVLRKEVHEEISIGDYVLTNGCLPAIVVLDALIRFIPDVLGHADAASEDSFENGLLDCPHYTRPEEFEGERVPEVLLSGDHAKIAAWRLEQAKLKTREVRPELWQKRDLVEPKTSKDLKFK